MQDLMKAGRGVTSGRHRRHCPLGEWSYEVEQGSLCFKAPSLSVLTLSLQSGADPSLNTSRCTSSLLELLEGLETDQLVPPHHL